MIKVDQIKTLSKEFKINDSVIAREYLQLLFLKELYSENFSEKIYFKGGTAIRIIYGGKRFSEDLDFTVDLELSEFEKHITAFFKKLENTYPVSFKERKTITGKTYLMTAKIPNFDTDIFISLDFSMRNDAISPINTTIDNKGYPIIITNFIQVLSKEEVFAEKVRAFLNRDKYRDFYDLWMLLELGAQINIDLINKKLKYYNEEFDKQELLKRLTLANKTMFVQDLRPFVSIDQRDKLGELFDYILQYLKNKFL